MNSVVALVNPKFPGNVGNVLRACSNFGASGLVWTPERVPAPDKFLGITLLDIVIQKTDA